MDMETGPRQVSRRGALGLFGAAATAAWGAGSAVAGPAAASDTGSGSAPADQALADQQGGAVQLLLNGSPAAAGTYGFPSPVDTVVLDNGLIRFTFSRDDAAGGIVTGWPDVSITASSVIVSGTELARNLNGIAPRDPDRQHSFYIDASGGKTRLVCSQIKVLRVGPDLAEVAFADTTSSPLSHEHHLIMRRGRRGLYGYDILTAVASAGINEVRMNTRWDRGIFDHTFNWERGSGQQPTYAYLQTQTPVQDDTWQIDGINNPGLPWPDSNSGNLPPGTVYSKYNWSLYHRENPMFGHYGHGFGAWLTPLGGITDRTLTAFYGVGPNHQDLAVHQDALILNYFGANHYGLPGYPLSSGYTRLYGPWYTYITSGDPDKPGEMIAEAAAIARAEIAENLSGSRWISDPLYPVPERRTTVTGRLKIADGRPADGFWVLLSVQAATDVYSIHEPAYYVKTDAEGNFSLPGIPPAWLPGTATPGTYTLYIFAGKGSITDQYVRSGITVSGARQDLGTITWAPANRTTFLWQIGGADRMGGEFALAASPAGWSNPRSFEKASRVPGNLTFTIGSSWEPEDWYYAQTTGGTWTITFRLGRAYTGTGFFTVSSSMQQGHPPTIAINGSTAGITGALPASNDSTIGRQADRSGFPRLAVLSFPASLLQAGVNAVTLTRDAGVPAGNGLGWDAFVMEVDEPAAPAPARLDGEIVGVSGPPDATVWTLRITNRGAGEANDVRLDGVRLSSDIVADGRRRPTGAVVTSRDPDRFPVPVTGSLPPGASATVDVEVDVTGAQDTSRPGVVIPFSANGGRARGVIRHP